MYMNLKIVHAEKITPKNADTIDMGIVRTLKLTTFAVPESPAIMPDAT